MEKNSVNSTCPICYEDFEIANFICSFEICLHEICYSCFSCLKSYSDKCPICSLFYKNIFKKDKSKKYEIIEIYTLTNEDYSKIKKNKSEILGNKEFYKIFMHIISLK